MTDTIHSSIKNYKFLSGSSLKIIAMITMLIDHTGAALLCTLPGFSSQNTAPLFKGFPFSLYELYTISRNIGRIAFPIYCFLLVEGFFHTKSKKKYALRLFLFALISEIPFNLAFADRLFCLQYQNVFWTLFLGFLCILLLERQKQTAQTKSPALQDTTTVNTSLILLFFIALATVLKTDYYGLGIILIAIFYYYHTKTKEACIFGFLSFLWEPFCFPAFLLIPLYNGKRGLRLKYLFYLFYPLHLLILYGLRLYFSR